MFRFKREKILPVFLAKGMTVAEMSRLTNTSGKVVFRAVNGFNVQAPIVDKIARALEIDALEYLEAPVSEEEAD